MCGDVQRFSENIEQQVGKPTSEFQTHVNTQSSDKSDWLPNRQRKSLAYLSDYVTDLEDDDMGGDDQVFSNIDYCYKLSAFPQTYPEAIESPDSSHWETSVKEEMNSLEKISPSLNNSPRGQKPSRGTLGLYHQGGC